MKDDNLYQYRRSSLPSRIAVLLLIITLSFCCISTGAAVATGDGSPTDAKAAIVGLEVPFVQNAGQIADRPDILYYADLFSGTAAVGHEGITYSFSGTDGGWVLRERFGSDTVLSPQGVLPSETRINYFIGSDPDGWKTGIPAYDVLSCGEIAPGIELELLARTGSIEKRFTVAPWQKPSSIVIEVEGAEGMELLPDGSISIATGSGAVLLSAPTAWQDTPSGHINVQVSYLIPGPDTYSFAAGPYNPAYPLVIDPLIASTFLGGTGSESVSAIAVDYLGEPIVVGYTDSGDFPTTVGAMNESFNGGQDGFLAYFDSELMNPYLITYIGGSGDDVIMSVILAGSDVCITGFTTSADFPTVNGSYNQIFGGGYDGFVAAFDSSTMDTLLASTFLGGSSYEIIYDIAYDDYGSSYYLTGYTSSADFPMAGSPFDNTLDGMDDIFVARMDGSLSTLSASTYLGGSDQDEAYAIALYDADGFYDVLLAGDTSSADFPLPELYYDGTLGGTQDGFGARLSGDLQSLEGFSYIGGSSYDRALDIVLDSYFGSAYICGETSSTDFPTTSGAFGESNAGGADGFIISFDNYFSSLQYGTYIGGSGDDCLYAVTPAIHPETGDFVLFAAGSSSSADFPISEGAYDDTQASGDGVIVLMDEYLYPINSSFIGGALGDNVNCIVFDWDNLNVFIGGDTESQDFPTTEGAYQEIGPLAPEENNAFVSVLDMYLSADIETPVHNIDTGLDYSTIQDAIDAEETSDYDTIEVDPGTYIENVKLTKSVALRSTSGDTADTIIQAGDPADHVIEVTAPGAEISGFTLAGATEYTGNSQPAGIQFTGSDNCWVFNVDTTGNVHGIRLEDSNYITIEYSNATYNTLNGITIANSTGNTFTGVGSEHNWAGFFLFNASNTQYSDCYAYSNTEIGYHLVNGSSSISIYDCIVEGHTSAGIVISQGSYCELTNSMVIGNSVGLMLVDSSGNIIYNNYFDNTVNAMDDGENCWNVTPDLWQNIIGGPFIAGNYWSDYSGVDTDADGLGNTLLPYHAGGNITAGGDYNPLTDVNGSAVVYVDSSGYWYDTIPYKWSEQPIQEAIDDQNTIPGMTMEVWSGYYFGAAEVTKPLTIVGIDDGWGLPYVQSFGEQTAFTLSACDTTLSNLIINHDGYGVQIVSDDNTVTNCDIFTTTANWNYGIYVGNSAGNRIDNCTLHDNEAYAIWINGGSTGNSVADNLIWNNSRGVFLYSGPTGNTIERNIITRNVWDGVCLWEADANTVRQNSLTANDYGITIWPATADNRIYANTFNGNHNEYSNDAGNSPSYWVSPGPVAYEYGGVVRTAVLGNYWGNYTGTDANGDGIGDTPYAVGTDSDTAPLVMPWQVYYDGLITEPPGIGWQRASGGTLEDWGYALTIGPSGEAIAAGWTSSDDGDVTTSYGGADVWLAALWDGTLIGQQNYGGSGDEYASAVKSVPQGVVMVGSTTSDDGDIAYNHGAEDVWVAGLYDPGMLNLNGASMEALELGWQNTLGGSGNDLGEDIVVTPFGYYVVGFTDSIDGDLWNNYGATDLWFVELDSEGYITSSRSLGGSSDDQGFAIDVAEDGNPVFAGMTLSNDYDVYGNHGNQDAWLVSMYFGEGWDVDWARCLGGSGVDCAVDVLALDEGYLVVGYTNSIDGDITSPHGGYDLWVVRTDCSGQIIWQRCYGGSGDDYGTSVTEASDGSGFVITGYTGSDDGHVTSNHGGADLWVLRIGEIGEILWQQTFGGSDDDYGRAIIDEGDGSYLVQGYTLSNDGDVSGNHGMRDFWTLQLAPGLSGPPVAAFTAEPFIGSAPLEVQFADASTGMPDSWAWNFGDGNTSADRDPLHTYDESGRYSVRLTVENGEGSDTLVRPEFIKVFAARYALDLDVPGVGVTDMGGFQRVVIDRAVCPGTVTIENNTVTVAGATVAIPQVAYTLVEVNEAGDLVWGDLVRAELTTSQMPAIIPGVGIVHPNFVIGLTWIPTAGQVEAGIIGGAGAQDLAAFESAAIGIGSSVDGVAYSLEVSTANLEGCLDGVTLVITMPRSAYDALGGDLKIFRRDDGGVTSILTTTLVSLTETEAVFDAFSPNGFSTYASVGLRTDSVQGQDEGEPPAAAEEPVAPEEELPPGEEPEAPGEEPGTEEPDLGPGAAGEEPAAGPGEQTGDGGIFSTIASAFSSAISSLASIVQEGGARAAGIGGDIGDKHVPAEAVLPKDAMAPAAVATSAVAAMVAIGFVATRTAASGLAHLIDQIINHLRKFIDFISNFLGEHVFEHLAEREASMEFLSPLSKLGAGIGITQFEVSIVAGGAILYGIAFYLADRVAFFPLLILIYIVVTGVAVAVHEFAHHMVAKRYSVHSQVKVYWSGIIVTFFTAWLFGNVFAQPLMTHIPETDGIDKRHKGIVMAAGPVVSIALACLFLLLIPFGGIWVLAGTVGFSANLLEAVYSLMPFHPLDGKGIAGWNKILWVLIFLPAIIVYLVLYTL